MRGWPRLPSSPRARLSSAEATALDSASEALRKTEVYLSTLKFSVPLTQAGHERHVSTIHALDHLGRTIDIAMTTRSLDASDADRLRPLVADFLETLHALIAWEKNPEQEAPVARARHLHEEVTSSREHLRAELLEQIAEGTLAPVRAAQTLETLRRLEELAYHLWRLAEHLRGERKR